MPDRKQRQPLSTNQQSLNLNTPAAHAHHPIAHKQFVELADRLVCVDSVLGCALPN